MVFQTSVYSGDFVCSYYVQPKIITTVKKEKLVQNWGYVINIKRTFQLDGIGIHKLVYCF